MGIQINGATDSITAIDGTIDVVSAIGNAGVVTATAFVGNITGNVTGNINHASNLELQVGGVTRANINSSGQLTATGKVFIENNLGIRNTTASVPLHVKAPDTGGGNIAYFDDTGSGTTARLMVLTTDGVASGGIKFQTVNKRYTYFGNSSNKLTIDNNYSRIGINTDAPSKELHVDGTIFASGNTSSLNGGLRIQPNNDGTNYGGVIYGGAHNDNNHAIYMRRGADGGNNTIDINSYGMFRVFTDGALASQDERLRITSSGLVGIGTNIPSGKLNLVGSDSQIFNIVQDTGDLTIRLNDRGSSSSYIKIPDGSGALTFETGGDERLRITSGGNIGVAGATGTDYSLLDGIVINTVNGSAGLIINSSSSSHNAYMSFGYGSGSGTSHADQYSAYIGRVGDNKLIFGTNNNIRASIDSNGNFNLGLTGSPAQSTTEQGVFLAGANSTQSVISSNVTPFAINRMGTGGNDRNCIEFRNNGSLKGTVGAVGVNNGIFFQSGVTEVMRITNDYKILVGLTTTGTSTSNNNFELASTKMLKVGSFYMGYVIGTSNNSDGVLILHKMGQNVGLQFSGMLTIHSYTGSAYLSGCIVVRYNTDVVTRELTLQKASSGANFELVSGTISGESGTYFGIKKNGGGTGSYYINAFVAGNIESYGGIREVSNSNWTTSTTHFTVT